MLLSVYYSLHMFTEGVEFVYSLTGQFYFLAYMDSLLFSIHGQFAYSLHWLIVYMASLLRANVDIFLTKKDMDS